MSAPKSPMSLIKQELLLNRRTFLTEDPTSLISTNLALARSEMLLMKAIKRVAYAIGNMDWGHKATTAWFEARKTLDLAEAVERNNTKLASELASAKVRIAKLVAALLPRLETSWPADHETMGFSSPGPIHQISLLKSDVQALSPDIEMSTEEAFQCKEAFWAQQRRNSEFMLLMNGGLLPIDVSESSDVDYSAGIAMSPESAVEEIDDFITNAYIDAPSDNPPASKSPSADDHEDPLFPDYDGNSRKSSGAYPALQMSSVVEVINYSPSLYDASQYEFGEIGYEYHSLAGHLGDYYDNRLPWLRPKVATREEQCAKFLKQGALIIAEARASKLEASSNKIGATEQVNHPNTFYSSSPFTRLLGVPKPSRRREWLRPKESPLRTFW